MYNARATRYKHAVLRTLNMLDTSIKNNQHFIIVIYYDYDYIYNKIPWFF